MKIVSYKEANRNVDSQKPRIPLKRTQTSNSLDSAVLEWQWMAKNIERAIISHTTRKKKNQFIHLFISFFFFFFCFQLINKNALDDNWCLSNTMQQTAAPYLLVKVGSSIHYFISTFIRPLRQGFITWCELSL